MVNRHYIVRVILLVTLPMLFFAAAITGIVSMMLGCTGGPASGNIIFITPENDPTNVNGPYEIGKELLFEARTVFPDESISGYTWDIHVSDANSNPDFGVSVVGAGTATPGGTPVPQLTISNNNPACRFPLQNGTADQSDRGRKIVCLPPSLPQGTDREIFTVSVTVETSDTNFANAPRTVTQSYVIYVPPPPPPPVQPEARFGARVSEQNTSNVQRIVPQGKAGTFFVNNDDVYLEADPQNGTLDFIWDIDEATEGFQEGGLIPLRQDKSQMLFQPQTIGDQVVNLRVVQKNDPDRNGTSRQVLNIREDKWFCPSGQTSRNCGAVTYTDTSRDALQSGFRICALGTTRCNALVPGEEVIFHSGFDQRTLPSGVTASQPGSNPLFSTGTMVQHEWSGFMLPSTPDRLVGGGYRYITFRGGNEVDASRSAPAQAGQYIVCHRATGPEGDRHTTCKTILVGSNVAQFDIGYRRLNDSNFFIRPQNIFADNDILLLRNNSICSACTDQNNCTACQYEWILENMDLPYARGDQTINDMLHADQNFNGTTKICRGRSFCGSGFDPSLIPAATGFPKVTLRLLDASGTELHRNEVTFQIGTPRIIDVGLSVNGQTVNCNDSADRKQVTAGTAFTMDVQPGLLTGVIDHRTGRIAQPSGEVTDTTGLTSGTLRIADLTWTLGCRYQDENGNALSGGANECTNTAFAATLTTTCNWTNGTACTQQSITKTQPGRYRVRASARFPNNVDVAPNGQTQFCDAVIQVLPGQQARQQTNTGSFEADFQLVRPASTSYPIMSGSGFGNPAYTVNLGFVSINQFTAQFRILEIPSGGQAPYTYQWNIGNGTAEAGTVDASGIASWSYSQFPAVGDYTVNLRITDATGANMILSKTIRISQSY